MLEKEPETLAHVLLVGFTGHTLWPFDTIKLPLIIISIDGKEKLTRIIKFSVLKQKTTKGQVQNNQRFSNDHSH